jgi:molybdenum cofactor biosynthesis protein B
MTTTPDEHKRDAPLRVRCAAVTISDTRTRETDSGGRELADRLQQAGHEVVAREIIPDEPDRIRQLLVSLAQRADLDAVLVTGGTGIAPRDHTFEVVNSLLTKALPGYGELFRMLSYAEIGAAAMLSRTTGGLMGRVVVLTMPGSRAAVRLALEQIIVPELGHLVREARR